MRLFYTPGSPYARIARVLAAELGLDNQITLVEASLRNPEADLLQFSPVGRVPVLETDDGTIIGESSVVCGYLSSLKPGANVIPGFGPDDLPQQRLRSLAMGMMDGIVAWFRETWRKNDASEAVLQLEMLRAKRTLDAFEREAANGKLSGPVSIGHIILACTLGWCDNRHTGCDWRTGRPKLVAWFEEFERRPSMQKTMPPAI
ncbi:MAG: glutathione S-transferase N-terminal domain-containing protein [Alphaproteobacteria bacterium]|nr:glutathione S-transferase N-terminal domain-containing protein [Alphaproteobacteria bacterium]